MSTTIAFSLNFPIQSCHAHQIRPVLPTVLADADVQRTIAMNKISTNLTKKIRLETKKDFLPLTPTIVPTRSPIDIDIQEKLETLILKTVDCEIIDLFNQMVKIESNLFVHSENSFRNQNQQQQHLTRIYRRFSPN